MHASEPNGVLQLVQCGLSQTLAFHIMPGARQNNPLMMAPNWDRWWSQPFGQGRVVVVIGMLEAGAHELTSQVDRDLEMPPAEAEAVARGVCAPTGCTNTSHTCCTGGKSGNADLKSPSRSRYRGV